MALVEEAKNSKTSWLKIGRIDYMSFVGNDVVAFAKGCFIVLYKISDDTETVYMANSYATGEGVQCFVGYQSAYMFAFAEMTPSPRIFLVTYPSFEHISVFQDGENIYSYLAMSFAEMECLVCLTGIPTFEIVVWSWRTGQKLASQPSNLFSTDQLIRCSVSMPIGVGQLSRYKNGSTLLLWEIHVCSKFCILHKTEIKNGLHSGTYVTAFCWSPEGIMYITDKEGNVYMIEEGSLMCKKVCAWPRMSPNQKMAPANLLWLKGGVVVSGPDGDVKFFKRSGKTNWAEMWVLYGKGPLVSMAVNRYRDQMVCWTEESIIYQVILEPIEELRQLNFYGHGFRLVEMIHPTDVYFATVDMNNDLCVWMKKSGELLESARIDQSSLVLDMACNPEMPYLALVRSDGALEIYAIYYGVPNSLNVLYLCNDQLSGVAFSSTGALIVTACYEIGRIFVTQGLVGTGRRMKVLEHLLTNKNIVKMVVSPDKSEPKLLILFNDGNVRKLSNELCVYSLPKLELMATINLPKWYSEIILNGDTYIGIPYMSRKIDIFNVNIGENTLNEIEEKESCHKLRKYHITGDQKHIVTYGWDGLVHVRDAETMVIFITFQPHHRIMKGVKRAVIDYKAKYVVTLGEEGNLVCTEILTNCGHSEKEHEKTTQFDETYFRRKTSVRETVMNILPTQAEVNKITWLQEKQQELLDMERKAAAPELQLIKNEFSLLQRELVQLLNKNENASPEQKLDILEFDLDEKNRNFLLNEAATERDNLRRLLEAEIKDRDKLFEVIKSNTWDKMNVKGRCIKAMLDDFKVENFPLLPVDPKFEEELKLVMERRKLVKEMSKEDHFEPWIPSSDTNEGLEESKTEEFNLNKEKQEAGTSKEEKENPYVLFGSSSHQFVPISDLHCSQFEMGSLFNSSSEIIMLEKVCSDLRLHFNNLFDEMFKKKEREMTLLAERNARLRTILSELEITCHAPSDEPPPIDLCWSQEEQTERIVTITDEEVPAKPYISPSEQELLDKEAAEKERIRLLLAVDNFREKALIEMMDGVLEVRWEDELKKEVPIPKCMIEKKCEDYNEADQKAIKDYEEKCKILQSERERYRKMLEIEYQKLKASIKDSLTQFDAKLHELYITKLKIDSAISHESLKILRIRQMDDNRLRYEEEEKLIKERIEAAEVVFETAVKEVLRLQAAVEESQANYELNLNKDKSLAKKFKSEFQNTNATLGMMDQLSKFFKRRPKIQQKAALYPTLLNELARLIMNPDQKSFLPPEFHDFLRGLDVLDQYSNCPSHIDVNLWNIMVQLRRTKIESEFKLKASVQELAEAETTLNLYTLELKNRKENSAIHMAELKAAREEKLLQSRDIQLQIVMPMGLVEVPLTGHISDFASTVLIRREIVEDINKEVQAAGEKKIAAMNTVTNYRHVNKLKEWECRKLRMECEDLQNKINNIEKVKVTVEVKQYLKDPDKYSQDILEINSDLINRVGKQYESILSSLATKIKEVEEKIKIKKRENKRLDDDIINLKCDVSEQTLERDLDFEKDMEEDKRKRMAAIVKRSQLVRQIQQAHKDNMVLQTELELLRLKTYPTLKYKSNI